MATSTSSLPKMQVKIIPKKLGDLQEEEYSDASVSSRSGYSPLSASGGSGGSPFRWTPGPSRPFSVVSHNRVKSREKRRQKEANHKNLVYICGGCVSLSSLWFIFLAVTYGLNETDITILCLIPLMYPLFCLLAFAARFIVGINVSSRSLSFAHSSLVLVLPALIQVNMGGSIVNSGGIISWGFFAPLTCLLTSDNINHARITFGVYIIEVVLLIVLEFSSQGLQCISFVDLDTLEVSEVQKLVFFLGNCVLVSLISYLALENFGENSNRSKKESRSLLHSILPPVIADEIIRNSVRTRGTVGSSGVQEEREGSFSRGKGRRPSFLKSILTFPVSLLPNEEYRRRSSMRGKLGVEARQIDETSVIMVDIVGFTNLSQKLSTGGLFHFLDEFFTVLDGVAEQFGVTKVRTIGDGYLAVSGLLSAFGYPEDNEGHAIKAILFGLEAIKRTSTMLDQNNEPIKLRIGIASGAILTGVVGVTHPQFDVIGPVANFAARLESTSIPGTVHISEETFVQASTYKSQVSFVCKPRKVELKNIGEAMTYDVDVEDNTDAISLSNKTTPPSPMIRSQYRSKSPFARKICPVEQEELSKS